MASYETLGKWLDTLVNIDILGRGIIDKLYTGAYEKIGEPLIYRAAREIKEAVGKNDAVLIMTGFRTPPLYVQETDGPLGAASLARTIDICLGGKPILITEPVDASLRILKAAVRGVGLSVMPIEEICKESYKHSASIVGFPIDEEKAKEDAKRLLDELNPRAVIAIEKAGRNSKNVYHNQSGLDISKYHAKVEHIITEAQKRDILTIGIGDGGNEVGMGVIEDVVRKHVPYGDVCQCPCKGGIAATSKVDVLVTAAISNWGGYALSGMLARMCNKPEGLHTQENEDLMFTLVISEGAIDGDKGIVERSADNVELGIHKSVLALIRQILFHRPHPVIRGEIISV
ncbi:DUF4392 domain-containing protein [Thermococcus aggregans]|uniref:DUF4392 domain-containing protein n=1 Tax=Thermococcus aggregans TaxID=110163 RepID=A0A9E7MWF2_THEAG|nr:DUF4392 domain-containing protein [Thermococcus aggregans]USS40054.1 DUF4392 domain-containing protein [Thermococcus aggregans]